MSAAFVETFFQLLFTGLVVGSTYGLMCVGLSLIFGIMRVINFAQGDFMMLGMYFGLFFTMAVAGIGGGTAVFVWAMVAAVLAGALFFVVGVVAHRTLIGRVTGTRVAHMEDEGHTPQLLLTLGISLFLQNLALMVFGSTPQTIRNPLSGTSWQITTPFSDNIIIFLNQARTWAAVIAVVVAVGLSYLMTRTRLGRQLRAAADNPTAAVYLGVDVNRSHRIAFGLGIALTTVSGVTAATYLPFQPYTGLEFIIIMYAGVVLGGLGSVAGAFWGGLIIGLVQQLSTLVLPVQLQMTAIFCVFLLILVVRPQGLFGRQVERA